MCCLSLSEVDGEGDEDVEDEDMGAAPPHSDDEPAADALPDFDNGAAEDAEVEAEEEEEDVKEMSAPRGGTATPTDQQLVPAPVPESSKPHNAWASDSDDDGCVEEEGGEVFEPPPPPPHASE